MPLIVRCPNGCIIRVPRARAGTMIRCTECKSVIQLRRLTPVEATGDQTIEIQGSPVEVHPVPVEDPAWASAAGQLGPRSPTGAEANTGNSVEVPSQTDDATLPSASHSDRAIEDIAGQGELDPFEISVPQPARLRFARTHRKREPALRTDQRPKGDKSEGEFDVGAPPSDTPLEFEGIQIDDEGVAIRFDYEFRFLSQFFAMCIGVMGLVLIVPSLLAWSGWAVLPVEPLGSRWIFIMIFLGALHIVYAIFLFQVQDRSALWSVSLFLLLVGCVHGVFTAGTWLDGGSGPVSRFLQLPPSETAAVTLWCFLHLCFSALLSYLCGRQALRWYQRVQSQSSAGPDG